MKSYKEKELIIFDFEDGKQASYNLNTGEFIGKSGVPVKSLCSAFKGMEIEDILRSFTDEKYRSFIMHVYEKFTPHSYRYCYGHGYKNESRVKNLGTLFKYVNDYKTLEQYWIAGIENVDKNISTPITDVPKGLLKLCRKHNKMLTDALIHNYKEFPDAYSVAFSMEFESLESGDVWEILKNINPRINSYFREPHNLLLNEYNYNLKALLKYIDNLVTFEGLNVTYKLLREIGDYANMMRQISDKYDKYPRYFLSTHAIAARNYNRLKREFDERNFQKMITPEYEITYKDYKFFYPKSTQEIKDEAVQQHNCVASYIQRVIEGDSHIIFLRKKDNPKKSVVTVQVRNGKIVQAYQAYNTVCTEEQQEAIEAFNKKFSKEK